MAEQVHIVGAKPRLITVVDQPKRRIEPAELAAALGANPRGHRSPANLDLIGLAELGSQLLNRLRSGGGKPALTEVTVNCRVPLSVEDLKMLEAMAAQMSTSAGAKPSVGQLVSVIVHRYLTDLESVSGAGNG